MTTTVSELLEMAVAHGPRNGTLKTRDQEIADMFYEAADTLAAGSKGEKELTNAALKCAASFRTLYEKASVVIDELLERIKKLNEENERLRKKL